MKQQTSSTGESSDDDEALPVRTLLSCRFNSQSTVSALSLFSECSDEEEVTLDSSRSTRSMHRINRFRASLSDSDKGLGKAPYRKGSLHSIATATEEMNQDSNHAPRIPKRQDTADRQVFKDAAKDDDRPRLCRVSGGINVFKQSSQ